MIIRNAFFIKRYLRKYNRSEVETLVVVRLWWDVVAHYQIFVFSQSCTEEPTDKGTCFFKDVIE